MSFAVLGKMTQKEANPSDACESKVTVIVITDQGTEVSRLQVASSSTFQTDGLGCVVFPRGSTTPLTACRLTKGGDKFPSELSDGCGNLSLCERIG